MGAIISAVTKALTVDESHFEELLIALFNESENHALLQASAIEQQLRVAGTIEDNSLTVPVSNVWDKLILTRVNLKADSASDLINRIADGIDDLFKGDITKGVKEVLTAAADKFFGKFEGQTHSERVVHTVMIGRALYRLDSYLYTKTVVTSGKTVNVNVAVVYKSVVDVGRLSTASFIAAFQYEFDNIRSLPVFFAYAKLTHILLCISNRGRNSDVDTSDNKQLLVDVQVLTETLGKIVEFETNYIDDQPIVKSGDGETLQMAAPKSAFGFTRLRLMKDTDDFGKKIETKNVPPSVWDSGENGVGDLSSTGGTGRTIFPTSVTPIGDISQEKPGAKTPKNKKGGVADPLL